MHRNFIPCSVGMRVFVQCTPNNVHVRNVGEKGLALVLRPFIPDKFTELKPRGRGQTCALRVHYTVHVPPVLVYILPLLCLRLPHSLCVSLSLSLSLSVSLFGSLSLCLRMSVSKFLSLYLSFLSPHLPLLPLSVCLSICRSVSFCFSPPFPVSLPLSLSPPLSLSFPL